MRNLKVTIGQLSGTFLGVTAYKILDVGINKIPFARGSLIGNIVKVVSAVYVARESKESIDGVLDDTGFNTKIVDIPLGRKEKGEKDERN
jgi:hypothetical protein